MKTHKLTTLLASTVALVAFVAAALPSTAEAAPVEVSFTLSTPAGYVYVDSDEVVYSYGKPLPAPPKHAVIYANSPKPGPKFVWVPGHYSYNPYKHRLTWIHGHWTKKFKAIHNHPHFTKKYVQKHYGKKYVTFFHKSPKGKKHAFKGNKAWKKSTKVSNKGHQGHAMSSKGSMGNKGTKVYSTSYKKPSSVTFNGTKGTKGNKGYSQSSGNKGPGGKHGKGGKSSK